MHILLLGKRYYTNKDALHERFGRIYQLPLCWHRACQHVGLVLLDYRGGDPEESDADGFTVSSIPAPRLSTASRLRKAPAGARPDIVVASGDCFAGLAAWHISRRLGVRFVFDVYDDYRTFGAYRAFLGWDAFGFLLRRASLVWYASHSLAREHNASSPWMLVPNGVNSTQFRPMDATACKTQIGLDPVVRWIGYFGSMEPERGPDDLIEAVRMLHGLDPRVRLVLCGGNAARERIVEAWVEDRGNVPHAEIPVFINACDVVVLPYRRGPTIDHASSVKMAEYLFCQRPIVATLTPSLSENFPQQARELGDAIARPSDPADLARAIQLQLDRPRIASIPTDQEWPRIAERALGGLRACVGP